MYPQAKLRPGSLPTNRIMFDYVGSWLAGWRNYVCLYNLGACPALGWLARPREAERGGAWKEQACHALGWRPQKAYVTHTCTHSRSQLCLWECFGEAWGASEMLGNASGRLGEAWGGLGKACGKCLGNDSGRLGEAWGGLFCPCSASLGKLGRLGAAWGGLGNAWERFGEAWGMFGNASGGSGRLGEAWGRLGECFVNASGKAWGGMLGNASGRLGPLWASASQPKGCFWSTCLRFYVFMVQPGRQPSA